MTYGLSQQASVSARDLELRADRLELHRDARRAGRSGTVTVAVPGAHNVTNSLAAVAVGLDLELPFEAIQQGLASFTGVDRRFQVRGEAGGVLVVDDYGHHPTEIRATLETLRRRAGARRTLVLFQPHRFTRTQALWDDFCRAFGDADVLRLVDIYPASEDADPGRRAREALARAIAERGHPRRGVGRRPARGERAAGAGGRAGRRGADARRRQRVDGGRRAAAEARGMTRRGLPVGPPPEELMELPLDPTADESPFLRPQRRTRLRPRRRGFTARALLVVQVAAVGLAGRRGRLDRVAARLRERPPARGPARGARQPLPLRGRGARARSAPRSARAS